MQNDTVTPLANSIARACDRLDVGRSFLYELIARGQLKVFKLGGRTLIAEDELQRLVAERVAESHKAAA